MALIAVQDIVLTGLDPTYSAANAGGDQVPNSDNKIFLHLKNADAASRTVTIISYASPTPGRAASNQVVVIPASGERMVGGFVTNPFNNPQNQIDVTYDDATNVTIAALRFNSGG